MIKSTRPPNRRLSTLKPGLWVWWQDCWTRVVNVIGSGDRLEVTLSYHETGGIFRTRPICAALSVHARRSTPPGLAREAA